MLSLFLLNLLIALLNTAYGEIIEQAEAQYLVLRASLTMAYYIPGWQFQRDDEEEPAAQLPVHAPAAGKSVGSEAHDELARSRETSCGGDSMCSSGGDSLSIASDGFSSAEPHGSIPAAAPGAASILEDYGSRESRRVHDRVARGSGAPVGPLLGHSPPPGPSPGPLSARQARRAAKATSSRAKLRHKQKLAARSKQMESIISDEEAGLAKLRARVRASALEPSPSRPRQL